MANDTPTAAPVIDGVSIPPLHPQTASQPPALTPAQPPQAPALEG